MSKVLLVGEPILDTMNPVHLPEGNRLLGCSEPQIYALSSEPIVAVGGVFYWTRFLKPFFGDTDIRVVFPSPNDVHHFKEFDKLVTNLHKRSIPWDREIYKIQRFVEMENPSDKPLPEFIDSIFRADQGRSYHIEKADIDAIAKELEDTCYDWLMKGGVAQNFLVLADYDLGLFTRGFLKKINEIIDKSVNIIVYARRQWRKYAEYFVKDNCTIVADLEYTIAELSDIEKLHDDDDLRKNPFRCIKSRFPRLKQFVLVDRKETRFACWNQTNKIWTLPTNHRPLFTPIGYRAIVGACLCLKDCWQDISHYLKFAHEAARYSGHVLLDKFSNEEAKEIKKIKLESLGSNPIELHPSESFQCHLCQNKLILDISKAHTDLKDVLTANISLKSEITESLKSINNPEANSSILSLYEDDSKAKYVFQKILFFGPRGSGKTYIAEQIAKTLFPDKYVVIHCNESKRLLEEINGHLSNKSLRLIILDEIGNIPKKGKETQKALLTMFADPPSDILSHKKDPNCDFKIIVLTCSLTREQMNKGDENNLSDFYDRFQRRFKIPALSDRPDDAAYLLAQQLLNKGIQNVSLQGLMTVVEHQFDSVREVNHLTKSVTGQIPQNMVTKKTLEEDWFLRFLEGHSFKLASYGLEARNIEITTTPKEI
jgi:DNA replication protein DnaC